jgi:chorismate dehydratase
MLKLGHINYSNCLPVHGRFPEQGPPSGNALIPSAPTQLLCPQPLDMLTGEARVGLPAALATSVTLLNIIMQQRLGIQPSCGWFEQESVDPFAHGFDAALYIGDVAYRRRSRQGVRAYDFAAIRREWTGLPFVFALWQTTAGPERDGELKQLVGKLAAGLRELYRRAAQVGEIEHGTPFNFLEP